MNGLRLGLVFLLSLTGCGNELDQQQFAEVETSSKSDDPIKNLRGLQSFYAGLLPNSEAGQGVVTTGRIREAVIGIFGGWNSCKKGPAGMDFFGNLLRHLVSESKKGRYYRVVASCYGKVKKEAYFFTSRNVKKIIKGDEYDVIAMMRNEARAVAGRKMILIGHSHGGWLAMKVAQNMPKYVNPKLLATIDPISRRWCRAGDVIKSYFGFNAAPDLAPDFDCTRAPTDFSTKARLSLGKKFPWRNFYQTDSKYLHSSSTRGAKNYYIHFRFTKFWQAFKAHMEIDADERVWSKIRPFITKG